MTGIPPLPNSGFLLRILLDCPERLPVHSKLLLPHAIRNSTSNHGNEIHAKRLFLPSDFFLSLPSFPILPSSLYLFSSSSTSPHPFPSFPLPHLPFLLLLLTQSLLFYIALNFCTSSCCLPKFWDFRSAPPCQTLK